MTCPWPSSAMVTGAMKSGASLGPAEVMWIGRNHWYVPSRRRPGTARLRARYAAPTAPVIRYLNE
ncbi:MAG: hypothetical protein EBT47_11250 [Chloroflexi bacterium]|nr:hypothetical protein [Chloroflexota bacterium]